MSVPVRLVCGGCLRSVEFVPGDPGSPGDQCPFCGGPIDSRVVENEERTRLREGCDAADEAELDRSGHSSDWAGTWSRGSFGSLGRFQLRERLGDGGFGHVYLAFDPRLDRDVALKVLKLAAPSERIMERFFREARAAARLDHPNIVAVYDAGFDAGRCWVAFHFVSGRPLDWYRDHHRLDPPTAARIVRDLADALDHAHRQGVVHRDIKPANVLIDDHGSSPSDRLRAGPEVRPRLEPDPRRSRGRDPGLHEPGASAGFSRQVDERSDVFSLGVIFFEVLCGRRPDTPESPCPPSDRGSTASSGEQSSATHAAAAAQRGATPSARALCREVPPALDRICSRAMACDPRERYPSARALADDLDNWLLQHKGGRMRLSFAMSTVILGLAAALLLAIGVRAVLLPWGEGPRGAAGQGLHSGPAGPSSAAAERPDDSPLIGNQSTKHYHRASCTYVPSITPGNRIALKSVAEAAKLGLTPCKYCLGGGGGRGRRPPQ